MDAAAPQRREERKVVSVLFADLVGFTARSEQLDPEDVRAVLAPYHDRLRLLLERHGGTVEKFIGDAVMALFGAPVAHEDDPERAVRAAIEIRDALRGESDALHVRIGVNTGEALVTVDAHAAGGEAMAAGDVVNTAARIQAAAPVDAVLVGERTFQATKDAIEYRPAEPVAAKGKTEPVAVWEAVAPRSRFGVDLAHRSSAKLAGRQRELELLISTLARVQEEQTSQLVTLVGVPGIGKSRLVGELFSMVDRMDDTFTWRQGRSLPYGEGVSFWALGEIVKAHAGILENDPPKDAEAKLRIATRAVAADDAEGAWLAANLGLLVALDGAGSAERAEDRFGAWRRFLEALAEQRPLVLVLEDLHWADDDLLDFVDGLVEQVPNVSMLVLGTARPELLDRRPGWGGGKPNAATVSLPPLSDEACEQLMTELLEQGDIPAEGRRELLTRIGGNPLYAEQYARALAERGDLSALPETVHGIIAARLDGLAAEEKRTLQTAAVIGKLFWLGAVETLEGGDREHLRSAFHRLERMQFVQRARRSSLAGEEEYAFRHVLIRDVAYGQIPRSRRGDLHVAAADWLVAVGRADDLSDTVAHHYTVALDYLPASDVPPSLEARARDALRHAGERALALAAYHAAVRYFEAAAGVPSEDDEDAACLLLGLGRARFGADGSGESELEAALGLARSAGDPETAAEAALALRVNAWYRGDGDLAAEWLRTASDLVRDRPDSRAKLRSVAEVFRSNTVTGLYEQTIERAAEALALARRVGPEAVRAQIMNSIGTSRVYKGDAGGVNDIRAAIEVAGEAGALDQVHSATNNLSAAQEFLGDLRGSVRTYEDLRAMVERSGREVDRRWVDACLASLRMAEGRWDEAIELANGFLAESEAGAPHYLDALAYGVRALISVARDDIGRALAESLRAVERGREAGSQVTPLALACHAAVLLEAGDRGQAGPALDELFSGGMPLISAFDHNLLDLAWTTRDLERTPVLRDLLASAPPVPWVRAARTILDGDAIAAAALFADLGCPFAEGYSRLRAAERAIGDSRLEAQKQLQAAIAIFLELKATRFLRRAEALEAEFTQGGQRSGVSD